jgi:putative salt-induced outer membrane protein
MRGIGVCAVVLLSLAAAGVRADEITLKNGDRLTGTIVQTDEKGQTLLIKTELEGDVKVKWEGITSIVSTQPLHLTLKDGQTIVGTVATTDGKFNVATKTTGEVTTAKDAVVAVRNGAEQKAYDDQIQRLENPKLTDFWSGVVDTGLSLTRGNSATLSYNLAAKAARVTKRDKISVYTTAIYSTDDTTPPSRTTAHAIRGGVRGDLNISNRTFMFALTDLEYDEFQNLDLRNTIGGGFGYYMIKNKKTQFNLFGGGTFMQEYYSVPLDPTNPSSTSRKSGEALAGEELATTLGPRLNWDERFSFYPNLSDTGEYRYNFDMTAATKINSWLGWQTTFSDHYISNPAPGKKPNDVLLSTGFRLSFGKGVF